MRVSPLAVQDALRQSQAQAERQAQDIAQLKEMLNKWQEETAETHRKNRAARWEHSGLA